MEYAPLGVTGITVSRLALGAMMFGPAGNPDVGECVRMVHTALDAGINLIDTADRYGMGASERIVGKAIAGRRDDVVVATKFWGPMHRDPNAQGGSKRWVIRACEESLRRLGTDHIDLYQMHRPDHATDPEETLDALDTLVRQGKVRALGTSTFPPELTTEMQWIARTRGLTPIRCEQPPYSIFQRGSEWSLLPTCERYGLGVIVWSPLNFGWLTGKYRRDAPWPSGSRGDTKFVEARRWDPDEPVVQRKLDLVDELRTIAADEGCSLLELAYAFVLEHPAVTAAIVGPRLMHHLTDALEHPVKRLSAEALDRIDAVVVPGTDVDLAELYYTPPAIADATRRRRATPRG